MPKGAIEQHNMLFSGVIVGLSKASIIAKGVQDATNAILHLKIVSVVLDHCVWSFKKTHTHLLSVFVCLFVV